MTDLLYIYCADGATKSTTEEQVGENKVNLVWKVILRTGTWKLRPGPGGVKLKTPLKVFRDKAPAGHISMAELVKNFDDNALEFVTVPLRHADGTEENTGYVRKLVIQDVHGEDGSKVTESLLWAGCEITEPDVAGKIERKTIPSVSAGVLFGYERTEDAKKFSQVLVHVCLTNKPWINGTGEFQKNLPDGVMASEDEAQVDFGEVELDNSYVDPAADPTKKAQPASGSVVWKPEEGYRFAQGRVQKALEDWRRQVLASIPRVDGIYPDFPYYHVDDINAADGKALICSGYGNEKEAWVVSFKFPDAENTEIEPFQNWTPAKQEWVAASQDHHPAPAPSPAPSAGQSHPASPRRALLTGLSLREAQAARAERFGLGSRNTTTTGGTRMGRIAELLAGVELSDDQRAAIAREEAEQERRDALLAKTATDHRDSERDALLTQVDAAGIGDPGLKRYIHDVYAGDDGEPAAEIELTLDEHGRKEAKKTVTASEILKGFIERLPKDKEGRVALSEQARKLPGDEEQRPAEKNDEKNDTKSPTEKRIETAREMLGQGLDISILSLSEDELKAAQTVATTNGGTS